MFDLSEHFTKLTVSGNYSPSDVAVVISGSNLASQIPNSGSGIFSVVWYDATNYPSIYNDPNKEICRVTGVVGQTLYLERGREFTNPAYHSGAGTFKMISTPTARGLNNLFYFRNPEKSYYMFDDFTIPASSVEGWVIASNGGTLSANPYQYNQQLGVLRMSPTSNALTYRSLRYGTDCYRLGSGLTVFEIMWNIENLPSTGNDFVHMLGFYDGNSHDGAQTDSLAVLISSGSPNYQITRAASTIRSNTIGSITATTGWHKFNIVVNQQGDEAKFYCDDVLYGSVSGSPMPTGENLMQVGFITYRRTALTDISVSGQNGTGSCEYILLYKELQPLDVNYNATGYSFRL